MSEFDKILMTIKEDLMMTRDGWEAEDVDIMCRYMYYKMKEQEMEKNREIKELKEALINTARSL